MPITYVNIASTTLGSAQSTVTFSSIPQTYTDIVIRMSLRSTQAGTNFKQIYASINGINANAYSSTMLYGNQSTANSVRDSGIFQGIYPYYINSTSSTANSFTNSELYIPSYTQAVNKPISWLSVVETNDTLNQYTQATANLFRNTSAITQVSIVDASNFAAGSSFYLYGIKNS